MSGISIDILDGLSSSTAIKGPCRVVSTSNVVLYGLQTIDSISLALGDRVLLVGQTAASENGIWVADTGQWRRSSDFNKTNDVKLGTQVFVTSGALLSSTAWYVTTPNPIAVGSGSIAFTNIAFGTIISWLLNLPNRPTGDITGLSVGDWYISGGVLTQVQP